MSAERQRQRDQVRGSVYSDKIAARSFRSPDNPFHTAHLLCNLITDERVSVDPSPPEHCQVLLLLWQRGMSAATVSVLQLAISLKKEETFDMEQTPKSSENTCTTVYKQNLESHFFTVAWVCLWAFLLQLCSTCWGMRKYRDDFQLIKWCNNY